jgi:hypothetical protein
MFYELSPNIEGTIDIAKHVGSVSKVIDFETYRGTDGGAQAD